MNSPLKDSGVEWLGRIPAHWEIRRLALCFREVARPGNEDLPVLSISIHDGISDDELDADERKRKVTHIEDRSKYKRVLPGDLAYNMMRAWQGGLGAVSVEGQVSPAYVVAEPKVPLNTRYVELLLRTPMAIEEMRRFSRGIADFRSRLYWEQFRDLRVCLPPVDEQNAILTEIAKATSRIDALILKKMRFIDLLRDKRRSMITRLVTKGTGPVVAMKGSGIEWLGDVPAHWLPTKIKYLIRSMDQGWSPQCESRPAVGDEWGVLKVGCVNEGSFDFRQNKALPATVEPDQGLSIREGDVLVSRANSRELVGSCAEVTRDHPKLLLCDKLYRLRPNTALSSAYLARLIEVYGRQRVETEATGTSPSMVNISMSTIRDIKVFLPPRNEVTAIVSAIEQASRGIDSLVAKTERSVELLREHRDALITAAVIGKIDLREAA